jgi:hypothetical protein
VYFSQRQFGACCVNVKYLEEFETQGIATEVHRAYLRAVDEANPKDGTISSDFEARRNFLQLVTCIEWLPLARQERDQVKKLYLTV